MERVTVKKQQLMDKLYLNLKNHREIYEEAYQGYKEEVIKELEKLLQNIKDGKDIVTHLNLRKPSCNIKDYERAIKMLEMSVDDEITLSEQEFSQFVLDEWHWKGEFLLNNMSYTKIK